MLRRHKSPEASILYGLWKSTSLSCSRYNTPTDPVRYLRDVLLAFLFISVELTNETLAIVRLHRSPVRHPFYDRFAETPFLLAFIPATYNLINQPSYRSYLASHPLDFSREVTTSCRLSLHQREIPFCIPRG